MYFTYVSHPVPARVIVILELLIVRKKYVDGKKNLNTEALARPGSNVYCTLVNGTAR